MGLFKTELNFDMVVTRGGDKGESSMYSGERRRKDDMVFQCVGDLDELNSYIGVCKNLNQTSISFLTTIQKQIISISALIATEKDSPKYPKYDVEAMIHIVESEIHRILKNVKIPNYFITPGDKNIDSAHLDVARTICRRCERNIVTLIRDYERYDLHDVQKLVNRLSDYFYSEARRIEGW